MVHHKNTRYLEGWCNRIDGLRRLSLDAIEHAELLDTAAKEVAAKTLESEMDTGYGIYAGANRHWATLSFDAQAAQWVSREESHPEQKGRFTYDRRFELCAYMEDTELAMDIFAMAATWRWWPAGHMAGGCAQATARRTGDVCSVRPSSWLTISAAPERAQRAVAGHH